MISYAPPPGAQPGMDMGMGIGMGPGMDMGPGMGMMGMDMGMGGTPYPVPAGPEAGMSGTPNAMGMAAPGTGPPQSTPPVAEISTTAAESAKAAAVSATAAAISAKTAAASAAESVTPAKESVKSTADSPPLAGEVTTPSETPDGDSAAGPSKTVKKCWAGDGVLKSRSQAFFGEEAFNKHGSNNHWHACFFCDAKREHTNECARVHAADSHAVNPVNISE